MSVDLHKECRSLGIKNYIKKTDSYLEKVIKVVVLLDQFQKNNTITKYEKVEKVLQADSIDLRNCSLEESVLDEALLLFKKGDTKEVSERDVAPVKDVKTFNKKELVLSLSKEGLSKKLICEKTGLSGTYVSKILKNES